jgi:hypothetical protein
MHDQVVGDSLFRTVEEPLVAFRGMDGLELPGQHDGFPTAAAADDKKALLVREISLDAFLFPVMKEIVASFLEVVLTEFVEVEDVFVMLLPRHDVHKIIFEQVVQSAWQETVLEDQALGSEDDLLNNDLGEEDRLRVPPPFLGLQPGVQG